MYLDLLGTGSVTRSTEHTLGSSPVDFIQCIVSVVMATLIKHGVYLRVTEKNTYL